jgi:hypothetical protein
MNHEQQIIAGMAITRMDAAKRALNEGETGIAKHHLRSAVEKIELIEGVAPQPTVSEQKRTGAFLEIATTTKPV